MLPHCHQEKEQRAYATVSSNRLKAFFSSKALDFTSLKGVVANLSAKVQSRGPQDDNYLDFKVRNTHLVQDSLFHVAKKRFDPSRPIKVSKNFSLVFNRGYQNLYRLHLSVNLPLIREAAFANTGEGYQLLYAASIFKASIGSCFRGRTIKLCW